MLISDSEAHHRSKKHMNKRTTFDSTIARTQQMCIMKMLYAWLAQQDRNKTKEKNTGEKSRKIKWDNNIS